MTCSSCGEIIGGPDLLCDGCLSAIVDPAKIMSEVPEGSGSVCITRAGRDFSGDWVVTGNRLTVVLFGVERSTWFIDSKTRYSDMAQILFSELVNAHLAAGPQAQAT